MKVQYIFLSILSTLMLFASCGLDNYDEPKSLLQGRVVYNGQPLSVKSGSVEVQLYQDGYEKKDPIPLSVDQDGRFQTLLFDGAYKLITKNNNGPWKTRQDTMLVNVHGTTNVDLEVVPYYILKDASMKLDGNTVKASVTLQKIVPEAKLTSAILVIGKTKFVDEQYNLARFNMDGMDLPDGTYPLSLDISGNVEARSARQLFGRIGVKADGSDQYIYTDVFDLGTPEPYVTPQINGQDMTVSGSNMVINMPLKKGDVLDVKGFDGLSGWWIDPDFLTRNSDEAFQFNAPDGNYAVIANPALKYFEIKALDSHNNPAVLQPDGSGAIWVIGENVGKPSVAANLVGWTPEKGLCMVPAGNKQYKLTLTAGKQIDVSTINFKFFHQQGWGGEFNDKTLTLAKDSDPAVFIGNGTNGRDAGNLGLKEGMKLEEGRTYVFVIDVSAGIDKAVLKVIKQ